MKVIIVALAFVAVAAAAAIDGVQPVPQTLRSENEQGPDGTYNFNFETENGISRQENGELRQVTNEENKVVPVIVVRGSYSYTDKEGNVETVNYIADENGFVAEGPSIPKSPSST